LKFQHRTVLVEVELEAETVLRARVCPDDLAVERGAPRRDRQQVAISHKMKVLPKTMKMGDSGYKRALNNALVFAPMSLCTLIESAPTPLKISS
jgi:hypothetical protein